MATTVMPHHKILSVLCVALSDEFQFFKCVLGIIQMVKCSASQEFVECIMRKANYSVVRGAIIVKQVCEDIPRNQFWKLVFLVYLFSDQDALFYYMIFANVQDFSQCCVYITGSMWIMLGIFVNRFNGRAAFPGYGSTCLLV